MTTNLWEWSAQVISMQFLENVDDETLSLCGSLLNWVPMQQGLSRGEAV